MRERSLLAFAGIAVLALSACKSRALVPRPEPRAGVTLTEWTGDDVRGLSGLARTDDGRFFAIPERRRAMIAFTVKDGRAERVGEPIAIHGAEQGLDTESLAWLGGDRFAIGTETRRSEREQDDILIGAIELGAFEVKERISFSYAPWSMTAKGNDGIEGLCAVEEAGAYLTRPPAAESKGSSREEGRGSLRLVASSETAKVDAGRRFAPLAVYDFKTKTWAAHRLWLTSSEGKISSLACRAKSGAIEIIAVERHFATMRILQATIGDKADVEPTIACDLRKIFPEAPPNFEGIEWLNDRQVLLVSDNDYRGVTGPAVVAVIEPTRACL